MKIIFNKTIMYNGQVKYANTIFEAEKKDKKMLLELGGKIIEEVKEEEVKEEEVKEEEVKEEEVKEEEVKENKKKNKNKNN